MRGEETLMQITGLLTQIDELEKRLAAAEKVMEAIRVRPHHFTPQANAGDCDVCRALAAYDAEVRRG